MALSTGCSSQGLFLLLFSVLNNYVVSSGSSQLKWTKATSFDNKLPQAGHRIRSRSRIDCGKVCSRNNECISFFFVTDLVTNCQLHNSVLNNDDGLVQVTDASYYILEGALTSVATTTSPTTTPVPVSTDQPFFCPPVDTIYRTVALDDASLFTYRIVKNSVIQPKAKEECAQDGAFLVRVTTVAKMNMLIDLVNCEDYYGQDYYVDGSNAGSSDSDAGNAWLMSNGEPVPMTSDFWGPGYPNFPDSQHCLRMKAFEGYKWDDCDCFSNSFYFICEK